MDYNWHRSNLHECIQNQDSSVTKSFLDLINSLDIHNIFNPSFYINEDLKIFAFRAIKNGDDKLTAFLVIDGHDGLIFKELTEELLANFDSPRLIDPKVTKLKGEYFVTFNSGWEPEGNNVYIMKIYPEMESPKQLQYNFRQEQERNWAFFGIENEIYALYWLNPLKILKLESSTDRHWVMEDYYAAESAEESLPPDLTIGTQLYESETGFSFVAHQKRYFQSKKVYLGRLCNFHFTSKKIHTGKNWLCHSLDSISGSDIKHNTNLYSCTYYSGIQITNGRVKLGYGINDIDFGFSVHQQNDL